MTGKPKASDEGSYTHGELAEMYNVSPRILHRWIEPILDKVGKRVGHYYNRRQVEVIMDHCGVPPALKHLHEPQQLSTDGQDQLEKDSSETKTKL